MNKICLPSLLVSVWLTFYHTTNWHLDLLIGFIVKDWMQVHVLVLDLMKIADFVLMRVLEVYEVSGIWIEFIVKASLDYTPSVFNGSNI